LVFVVFFLLATVPGFTQNILVDGDFSKTTDIENNYGNPPDGVWSEYISYYIAANATVVNGVCNFYLTNPGSENWEIQLTQAGLKLESGHAYKLSFDVKADKIAPFGVYLGENGGSWINFIGLDGYWQKAITEWQTVSLNFNVPPSAVTAKLSFELGLLGNNVVYFDNVSVIDLGEYTPIIGVIGTAVNGGWDEDVSMETADGISYMLNGFPLTNGDMKFRLDHMWSYNWGDTGFPTGTGYLNGPNIPVPAPGTYNILFNRETGAYSFECVDKCLPLIGIIGSAVPPGLGSDPDINLTTSDGETYTLFNYMFVDGKAKFRLEDKWDTNWGGTDFPTGTAVKDGPEIPVQAGIYNVSFKLSTGEYKFERPQISIIGPALSGWETDIDMKTVDGIVYTLTDQLFSDGLVKFRMGHDWNTNWGGWEFPSGTAWSDGPDLFVMAGTYNVTFNRETGEYHFEATTCPIVGIQCPWDQWEQSKLDLCGNFIYYPEVTAAPNCGGKDVVIEQVEGLPSGSFFPLGPTFNRFILTNADGNTAMCGFTVYVYDIRPPEIKLLKETYEPIWPPNNKMVDITLDYEVTDDCGTPVNEIYIWSNEPDGVSGNDSTSYDWEIVDDHHIRLRAERSAQGTGREYYIWINSRDEFWNYSGTMLTITVPHDYSTLANGAANKTKSALLESGSQELSVNIWPNPTADNFSLELNSPESPDAVISVFDLTGRLIHDMVVQDSQTIQFGEELMPGIYIVNVRNGSNMQNFKIVKE